LKKLKRKKQDLWNKILDEVEGDNEAENEISSTISFNDHDIESWDRILIEIENDTFVLPKHLSTATLHIPGIDENKDQKITESGIDDPSTLENNEELSTRENNEDLSTHTYGSQDIETSLDDNTLTYAYEDHIRSGFSDSNLTRQKSFPKVNLRQLEFDDSPNSGTLGRRIINKRNFFVELDTRMCKYVL